MNLESELSVSEVDLKELTKTLDYLRRFLEHEQIMAVSKLYAWWLWLAF